MASWFAIQVLEIQFQPDMMPLAYDPNTEDYNISSDLPGLHSETLFPREKRKEERKEKLREGTMNFKTKLVPNTKVFIHLKGEKGFWNRTV